MKDAIKVLVFFMFLTAFVCIAFYLLNGGGQQSSYGRTVWSSTGNRMADDVLASVTSVGPQMPTEQRIQIKPEYILFGLLCGIGGGVIFYVIREDLAKQLKKAVEKQKTAEH